MSLMDEVSHEVLLLPTVAGRRDLMACVSEILPP